MVLQIRVNTVANSKNFLRFYKNKFFIIGFFTDTYFWCFAPILYFVLIMKKILAALYKTKNWGFWIWEPKFKHMHQRQNIEISIKKQTKNSRKQQL